MTIGATCETHNEKYCGQFLLRRGDFAPQKLTIELDRLQLGCETRSGSFIFA
jgi:hypothetical protein